METAPSEPPARKPGPNENGAPQGPVIRHWPSIWRPSWAIAFW